MADAGTYPSYLERELVDTKKERDYYKEWADRFSAMLAALDAHRGDPALWEEADGYLMRYYRDRLEGKS